MKHIYLQKKIVRIRAQYIVTQLPEVKGIAGQKKKHLRIWTLFFTENMLEKVVQYTKKYTEWKKL